MSIKKIKELAFHLSTFRNIDLLNQGLYQIRIRAFIKSDKISKKENIKDKSDRLYAVPYHNTDCIEVENVLKTEEIVSKPHNVIHSHIRNDKNEFASKSFLIRYSDEEVELDDYCYFRLETDNNVKVFYIEVELNFSDNISNLNFKSKQKVNNYINKLEFKVVQSTTITINEDSTSFQESYLPILFQESYSSLLNINLSVITLEYKLRADGIQVFSSPDTSNKLTTSPIISQQKEKDSKDNVDNSSPNYLLDFFITDDQVSRINLIYNKENNCLLPNFVDALYDTYVLSLMNSYSSLRNKYVNLAQTFIDNDKLYSEMSYFISLNQFIYYTDSSDTEFPTVDEINFNYQENKALLRRFSKRLSSLNVEYVLTRVLYEITVVSSQLAQLWHKYLELLRHFPNEYSFIMEQLLFKQHIEDLNKFRKRQLITINDEENFVFQTHSNQLKINTEQSEITRTNITKQYLKGSIDIANLTLNPTLCPILIEESYTRKIVDNKKFTEISNNKTSLTTNIITPSHSTSFNNYSNNRLDNISNNNVNVNNSLDQSCSVEYNEDEILNDSIDSTEIALDPKVKALHLVVLVHGFQGNSFDMRLIKYNLSLLNSTLVFLSSQINQDDTENDFMVMGERLAGEVKNFIKEWNDGIMFKRISFIGHSIGGLIIRAALPLLKEYSKKMYFYCSLSSPHLGYMYSSSTLIDAGMWVLKKIKKCKSLDQLSLSDDKNMYNTCLYKLSEVEGFEWFEHIFLISGHQDYYAPFESTRIQLCDRSIGNDSKGQLYRKMANNLLGKLTKNSLRRIDTNFVISER